MSFGNLLPDSAHSAYRNGSLFKVVKVLRKKRLSLLYFDAILQT